MDQFICGYEETEKQITNIQEILNSQTRMEKQAMETLFNSDSAKQNEHFVADNCFGITKVGQAILNQSIESIESIYLGVLP